MCFGTLRPPHTVFFLITLSCPVSGAGTEVPETIRDQPADKEAGRGDISLRVSAASERSSINVSREKGI